MSATVEHATCPECPAAHQDLESGLLTSTAEASILAGEGQQVEAPKQPPQPDHEKTAAAVADLPQTDIAMKASPENPERRPAPPAAADVQPPSYVRDPQLESLKRRPQRHHCHLSWLPYPSKLALIRILFILNAVLLLATTGACIVMLLLAIREKDPYPRRLRWSLFLLEIGFTFFYARDCWTYSTKYANYWKHIDCRHCVKLAQSNTTPGGAV